MTTTDTIWYHGTTDESGLDEGDYLDPSRGHFEPCVWITSCPKVAAIYARAAAVAAGEDAEPVVYEVRIIEGTQIDEGDETSRELEIAVITNGEYGVPMTAVLNRYVAKIERTID